MNKTRFMPAFKVSSKLMCRSMLNFCLVVLIIIVTSFILGTAMVSVAEKMDDGNVTEYSEEISSIEEENPGAFSVTIGDAEESGGFISGAETSAFIFLFVMGIVMFRTLFNLVMANGTSRRTMFFSGISSGFVCAAVISVFFMLIGGAFSLISTAVGDKSIRMFSTFEMMYYNIPFANGFVRVLIEFVYNTIGSFQSFVFGLFIGALYYRMNQALKIIVSVGVPASFLVVIPIIASAVPNIEETFIGIAFKSLCSFIETVVMNPYASILWTLIITALIGLFGFLLLRRAPIKNNDK